MTDRAKLKTVRAEQVMGTVVSIEVRGEGDRSAGIEAANEWLHSGPALQHLPR